MASTLTSDEPNDPNKPPVDDDDDAADEALECGETTPPAATINAASSQPIAMPRPVPLNAAFEHSIRNSPYARVGNLQQQPLAAVVAVHSSDGQATPTNRRQPAADDVGEAESDAVTGTAATATMPSFDRGDADLLDLIARMEAVEREQREQAEADAAADAVVAATTTSVTAVAKKRPHLSRGNSVHSHGWSERSDDGGGGGADDDEDALSTTTSSRTAAASTFSTLVARHRRDAGALDPAEVWRRFEASLVGDGGGAGDEGPPADDDETATADGEEVDEEGDDAEKVLTVS